MSLAVIKIAGTAYSTSGRQGRHAWQLNLNGLEPNLS